MANTALSALAPLTAPTTADKLLVLDVNDTSMGPAGSDKVATIGAVLALASGGGGGGTVPGMHVIWADNLTGVSSTGSSDTSGPVQTAVNALNGAACLVVCGVGTYNWATAVTLGRDQSIVGMGSRVTNFTWSGNGPLFTASESTFTNSHTAGQFSGFTISGPYGSGSSAGIKYGSLQGIRIDDVAFYGLPGGAVTGYKVGASDWAEEAQMTRLDISECGATSGYVFGFAGTSFDYLHIDAVVVVEKNIDVIALSNTAQVQGGQIAIRGNLHGGLANTGAVVSIDRGNTAGTSYMTNVPMAVSMECNQGSDGGTLGHYLLWMGSANSTSQFSAFGVFRANAAGATCQGWNNPNFVPTAFAGDTQNLTGGAMAAGGALAVLGATRLNPGPDGFGTFYQSNVYWQFGDVQTGLLAAGAQTLVFNGTDGFAIRGTLFLLEPSSGTAPAVTFPASASFTSGGGTPVFAATGHTHKIECTYLPKESKWVLDYRGYY